MKSENRVLERIFVSERGCVGARRSKLKRKVYDHKWHQVALNIARLIELGTLRQTW